MTVEELKRNLEYTKNKHRNDFVPTSGTNISAMCQDTLSVIKEMENDLEKSKNGFVSLLTAERAKVIDEVKDLIKVRLVDSLALENATKYGNENAKQQANSYATVMKYEIADCIDDLLDDVELLKEQK